jgi:ArsR family transcriptional regulator
LDEETEKLAAVFKALSEPVRLRLLERLPRADRPGEISVCELAESLDIPQPNVSHHLGILKAAGLVRFTKESCKCYYSVDTAALEAALSALRVKMQP